MAQLKEKVPALRWIDFDTGQLESPSLGGGLEGARPPLAFPCALLTISVVSASDITDFSQECRARLRVRLAFDQQMRTAAATPAEHLNTALQPYNVIADVYAALQGFATPHFTPLSRTRQEKENSRSGLFIYFVEFALEFDDETANQ